MSYCVNCGVRLADSEKICPLCSTPVINPNEKKEERDQTSAYPDSVEKFRPLNKKFIIKLLWLGVFIVSGIVLLLDLLTNGRVTWSAYVFGGVAYAGAILTFLSVRSKHLMFLCCGISTLLLLYLIAWRSGGIRWFIELALPVTIIYFAYSEFCWLSISKKNSNPFFKTSLCLLAFSLTLIGTECVIDYFVEKTVSLVWSLYAATPFAVVGLALLAISLNKKLMEDIKKRSFL